MEFLLFSKQNTVISWLCD